MAEGLDRETERALDPGVQLLDQSITLFPGPSFSLRELLPVGNFNSKSRFHHAEPASLYPPGSGKFHERHGRSCASQPRRSNQRGHLEKRIYGRSEEHTSELQSRGHLVCRLLLKKKLRSSCCCDIICTLA